MGIKKLLRYPFELLLKSPLRYSVLVIVAALAAPLGQAQPAQISSYGFGDRQNSYPWATAWFKGKLYVGTARNVLCVERATIDYYYPGWGIYSPFPDPNVPCAPDRYDLNLQAEIWAYTPETNTWERVFQSPNSLAIPQAPGKFTAPDIAFRGMVVFKEHDGTEALYAGGVTAREYIPGLPPPRILRSTDGVNWNPIPQDPGTFLGNMSQIGFRSMLVFNNRLYVTASTGLTGDGVLLESDDPAVGNNSFRQISPPDMRVFELTTFNNYLYIGAGDQNTGYSVFKTTAAGYLPYAFTPVVTDGAGRGVTMTSVVSMQVFKDRLYVGSSGWAISVWPTSELIRVNPDDSWDLVVGNPRWVSPSLKWPISGIWDSFNNFFNHHFWRMAEHQGALYVGTNDGSWGMRTIPWLDFFLSQEYGFDLYTTTDGVYWTTITRNGFGSPMTFGVRNMDSTAAGLFLGGTNQLQGALIFLTDPPASLTPPLASTALDRNSKTIPSLAQRMAGQPDNALAFPWNRPPQDARLPALRASVKSVATETPVQLAWTGPMDTRLGSGLNTRGVTNFNFYSLLEDAIGVSPRQASKIQAKPTGLHVANADNGNRNAASNSAAPPAQLISEQQNGITVLSWSIPTGAAQFHVFRADYAPNPNKGKVKIAWTGSGYMPPGGFFELPADAQLPRGFKEIGMTSQFYFQDASTESGQQYRYYVLAENSEGRLSLPSNTVVGVSAAPSADFEQLDAKLQNLDARGKIKKTDKQDLANNVAAGKKALKSKDWKVAHNQIKALKTKIKQKKDRNDMNPLDAETLDIMADQIDRRVSLGEIGVIDP